MYNTRAVILSLVCFCSLYSIKLSVLPITLGFLGWIPFACIAYIRNPIEIKLPAKCLFPFISVFILMIYSVFISTLRGNAIDYSVPYNFFIWLLVFLPSALVLSAKSCSETKGDFFDVNLVLVAVILLQAIFIYISFYFNGFREFCSNILVEGSQDMGDINTRVKGFSSGGGAALSLIQGVGAAVCFRHFITNGSSESLNCLNDSDCSTIKTDIMYKDRHIKSKLVKKNDPRYLFAALLMAGSTLFTGRTGVIFIALFLIAYIPYCICTIRISFKYFFMWFFAFVFIVFSGYNLLLTEELKNLFENQVMVRSFDLFLMLFSGESVGEHNAISVIKEMYSFPDNIATLLVGDGLFSVDGINYTGDPGYVKYIYFFGLAGCFAMYGYFLLLMILTIRNCASTESKVFIFIFYLLFFIFETKEPFFAKLNFIHHLMYFRSVFLHNRRAPFSHNLPAKDINEVPFATQGPTGEARLFL